ncbi:stage II sporulation protein P [Domibacillus sp. DTU_2020_1001157_1_SI_ALB_TIR_016]|uniref:stage II sporulation protein P n=1 Tax=Domibacillus sp. DTU_2020_1001157_1_SI_ALB_TIR_016 TaxID=3077789 RepID=UPI0028EFF6BF|nr:stage II sporulation protein P [Domibacillus sp. DTU_2020_1001157_1_SI_ALB_TIR_016]WNS81905.1 stage II sporulation protein P [Domibacillus sp. DTU_2020_1001157_1_SI_ALB_TIR_016]
MATILLHKKKHIPYWLVPVYACLVVMPFWMAGFLTVMPFSYHFTSQSMSRAAAEIPAASFYQLLRLENHAFQSNEKVGQGTIGWVDAAFQSAAGISLRDPRTFLGKELPGFSIYDSQILIAGEGTDYTNLPVESKKPDDLPVPKESEPDEPKENTPPAGEEKVLLYFTHTSESFTPKNGQAPMNITEVGTMIGKSLEEEGIGVSVNKTDIGALLKKKGKKYSASYEESRTVVAAVQKEEPSLSYLIDIHRDSQGKSITTARVNGQDMAKTVFVVGGEHPGYEENARFASSLHKLFEQYYPGLSRGVIVKSGSQTNGKFNQDLSNRAILIEMGGVDNTREELERSAAAVADILARFIKAEQNE